MSKDKKSEQSKDKVVPIKPSDSSQAGGASAAPSQDGQPSRPQTVEEVGIKLAQEIIAEVLKDAKDDEVIAKLLTTTIERECVTQTMMMNVLQAVSECTVHAQRSEGMLSYIMRRHGEPVQLPPAKEGDKPKVVFKTWHEEWKALWEQWEQRQLGAAGGVGNNGKEDSEKPRPKGGGKQGA